MQIQTIVWFGFFFSIFTLLSGGKAILNGQNTPKAFSSLNPVQHTFRRLTIQLPESYTITEIIKHLNQQQFHFAVSPMQTELRPLYQKLSQLGEWITFQQWFKGYPIEGKTLKVFITPTRILHIAMDGTISVASKSLQPLYTFPLSAITQRLSDKVGKTAIIRTDSIWYHYQDKWYTAYKVMTNLELEDVSNSYYFNAQNGQLIDKVSNGCNRGCRSHGLGLGNAFCPDPLTTLQANYQKGTNLADNNDTNNVTLDSAYCRVVLNDLLVRNDTIFLQGPYVKITDIRSPRTPKTISKDGNFFFNRSESGFEDVNVYYHIDTMQRYVQSIGLTELGNYPLNADPHGQTLDNSAFFAVDTFKYLLFGTGGVDDAEDADVIIHEYTHALSHAANPQSIMGFERRALEEGIADYFAASYSYRHSTFRWQDVYTWDGHNEFWPGRSAQTTKTYQDTPMNNIYEVGELWSTAMMGVLQQIGTTNADKLSLHQLYMNNNGMTLKDAALSLLVLDTILFQGAYTAVIRQQFCKVGILTPPLCPTAVLEEKNFEQISPQAVIYPNPCSDALNIEINDTYPHHYRYQCLNSHGILLFEGAFNEKKWSIHLNDLNHGLYLLMLYRSGHEDQVPQVFKVLKQ